MLEQLDHDNGINRGVSQGQMRRGPLDVGAVDVRDVKADVSCAGP
jgi:hypothetical protein